MSVISIKNLSFSYDKQTILENINLDINEKDFLAIIGPNGGGKSTLLKSTLGIIKPKIGTISVFDKTNESNINKVGYVPQNTNINTNFPITVLEVVMMGHVSNKLFNIGYSELEKSCALSSLQQVGMNKFANEKIGNLSGGQRQRVMIARALCNHPQILLLDEPTASIDVEGQRQIYDLLKELNKQITIVVVSHDISVILGYANKVAHINKTLTYHDISSQTNIQHQDGHFCEVEMLQMFGNQKKSCSC
jgi:zinc transport system ATP-binding protein